jgi:hypothetical protein
LPDFSFFGLSAFGFSAFAFAAFVSALGLSVLIAELAVSRTRPPCPQQEKCPTFGFEPSLHEILVACADSVEAESMSMAARNKLTRSGFIRIPRACE